MSRKIYTCLLALLLPFIALRLLWRSGNAPAYRQRWGERFARRSAWPKTRSGASGDGLIHVHAVSVGEVHGAEPLIREFLKQNQQQQILLTTSTPTGSARVKALFGDQVLHVYLPYDLSWYMNRFLRYFSPRLIVIMETELWPNLIAMAHRQGIKLALVNARLSARSAKGYARLACLSRPMLKQLDIVCAQSQADADRFAALGLEPGKLNILPSLKYDIQVPVDQISSAAVFRQQVFASRPVLIAASTREGEEEKVLEAFSALTLTQADAVLILVPRHPERFESVRLLAEAKGFKVGTRTGLNKKDPSAAIDLFIGDTMGEMFFYYAMSDIAFVGGSLVDTGCQNILEPAALGLPVLTGPSLFNFQAASDELCAVGGQQIVRSPEELAMVWQTLLENSEKREAMGSSALTAYKKQSGASKELLTRLQGLM